MTRLKTTTGKANWGGARPGGGRPKVSRSKHVTTAFSLPPEQVLALARIAKAHGISRSAALADVLKSANIIALADTAIMKKMDTALEDDEPITADEKEAIAEARDAIKNGDIYTLEQVENELGL